MWCKPVNQHLENGKLIIETSEILIGNLKAINNNYRQQEKLQNDQKMNIVKIVLQFNNLLNILSQNAIKGNSYVGIPAIRYG
jgi:hypothetical protein